MRRLWTGEEEKRLRELVEANRTKNEIAAELGRTPCGVSSKLKKLGLRFSSESIARAVSYSLNSKTTLCWDCKNATNGACSWSRSLTPVKGWTARQIVKDGGQSYLVTQCPKFREG